MTAQDAPPGPGLHWVTYAIHQPASGLLVKLSGVELELSFPLDLADLNARVLNVCRERGDQWPGAQLTLLAWSYTGGAIDNEETDE